MKKLSAARKKEIHRLVLSFMRGELPRRRRRPKPGSRAVLIPINGPFDLASLATGVPVAELEAFHEAETPAMRQEIRETRRKANWHNRYES